VRNKTKVEINRETTFSDKYDVYELNATTSVDTLSIFEKRPKELYIIQNSFQ